MLKKQNLSIQTIIAQLIFSFQFFKLKIYWKTEKNEKYRFDHMENILKQHQNDYFTIYIYMMNTLRDSQSIKIYSTCFVECSIYMDQIILGALHIPRTGSI